MRRVYSAKKLLLCLILLQAGLLLPARSQTNIEQIRRAIQEKGAHWTAGENWVTRLDEASRLRLLGSVKPDAALAKTRLLPIPAPEQYPSDLDWRNYNGNWLTSVRNQGNCGSCWAFSATAQLESWWKIQNVRPDSAIDLSEQFLISSGQAGSCNGGGVNDALTFFQQTGIPGEDCMPYAATDTLTLSAACSGWESEVVKIPGWGYVTTSVGEVDNIKAALMRHPVSATYTVFDDFYSYYGGVYEHVSGEERGGHAVLIVGWSDADSCWICKNSWGRYWGENGYFRIKWGQCTIETFICSIYDVLTQGVSLSRSRIDVEVRQDEERVQSVFLRNAGSERVEFSAVDFKKVLAFHPDTLMAWQGKSIWCGDKEIGGYDNHWLQYLDTPELDLSGATDPLLRFMGRWEIEDPAEAPSPWDGWDGWNVWISTNGGQSFQVIQPDSPSYNCASLWSFGNPDQGWDMGTGIAGWGGSSGGWIPVRFDLQSYSGASVIIRFAFASDMGFCTADDPTVNGLFLDDIRVEDGSEVLFENDGESLDGMTRQGEGTLPAEWMELGSGGGTIVPGDSIDLDLTVRPGEMDPGEYQAWSA